MSQSLFPSLSAAVLVALASTAAADPLPWSLTNGQTVTGSFLAFSNGQVLIRGAASNVQSIAFDALSVSDRQHVLATNDTRAPAAPPWIPGYRLRYTVRVIHDLAVPPAKTIIASLPTGGWLRPDAADLMVQSQSGAAIAPAVLSHSPRGDTIIQFQRQGYGRFYWVYGAHPAASNQNAEGLKKAEAAKRASQDAVLAKMAALKASADRAAEHRDLVDRVNREAATAQSAAAEIAAWEKLLPERTAAAQAAAAKAPPARAEMEKAAAASRPLEQAAAEKSALGDKLAAEAAAAKDAAQQAAATREEAARGSELAKAQADKAGAEAKSAADTAARADAEAQAGKAAEKSTAAKAAREASRQAEAAAASARDAAAGKAKALQDADTALAAAQKNSEARAAAAKTAADAAQAARLTLAPAATAKAAAEQNLAATEQAAKAAEAALAEARQRMADAAALKQTCEKNVATLTPKRDAALAAAAAARAAAEKSVAEAQAREQAYFQLASQTDARLFKEGLTAEFRQWEGDRLGSWAEVVEGLNRSDTVVDNAVIGEIQETEKPFRRGEPRNFAASYRGYLRIDQPGVYSFCLNGDDATFLFIDGYLVYSRTGSNRPLAGTTKVYAIGADIELEAGVHVLEAHHVVGNTPGATGYCKLIWLAPGSKQWAFVPRSAFVPAMMALPVDVEAADGAPLACFDFSMDDALSSDGVTLCLGQFEAHGRLPTAARLEWDFGDGTRSTGPSPAHVFFSPGDYTISLKSHPSLAPFRRLCHVDIPAVPTSPLAPAKAVEALGRLDGARLDPAALNDMFHFLLICEQPNRWPVMERTCRQLLERKGLDLKYRTLLQTSLMRAMAEQGRAADALKLETPALQEADSIRTLRALVMLQTASLYRDVLHDVTAADGLYTRILDENRRLRHRIVREAAVAWGDLFLESGDFARAGDAYRLARTLGSGGALAAAHDDPTARGAMLRVAEQQLKAGDVRQTRRMLRQIETEFPEQKLEGLYQFLRGEADRYAGDYENAIRHYELLLKLPQWASYRPNGLLGIADSFYRMGAYTNALEWIANLESAFPAFFEQRQLAAYRENIAARNLRLHPPGATNGPPPKLFASIVDDFELPSGLPARRSMGWKGPGTTFLRTPSGAAHSLPEQRLVNVPGQGAVWVELWYRDWLGAPGIGAHRSIDVQILSDARAPVAQASATPERTFGRWQKAAFLMAAPTTPDGIVRVTLVDRGEAFEVDGLAIAHISDSQTFRLRKFIEGADPQ